MSLGVWAPRHEAGAFSVRFFFLTSLLYFDVEYVIFVFCFVRQFVYHAVARACCLSEHRLKHVTCLSIA